jgi:hypothetical protein
MQYYSDDENDQDILRYQYETVHWKPLSKDLCNFPPPTDISINMMPFYAEKTFSTIPEVCWFVLFPHKLVFICLIVTSISLLIALQGLYSDDSGVL